MLFASLLQWALGQWHLGIDFGDASHALLDLRFVDDLLCAMNRETLVVMLGAFTDVLPHVRLPCENCCVKSRKFQVLPHLHMCVAAGPVPQF